MIILFFKFKMLEISKNKAILNRFWFVILGKFLGKSNWKISWCCGIDYQWVDKWKNLMVANPTEKNLENLFEASTSMTVLKRQ